MSVLISAPCRPNQPVTRHALAAVAVGVGSFALAAIVAFALTLALLWGGAGLRMTDTVSPGWAARVVAFLATGLAIGVTLCVLFGTAARVSTWLQIPRWWGVAVAGVLGGAGLHWLLLSLTVANSLGIEVSFPYWWKHYEIDFR